MATAYQKIKINSKITILEAELLLIKEKIKNYDYKLQKISKRNPINILNDKLKIDNVNIQVDNIQKKIDIIKEDREKIKKQLLENPINNEEELDRERIIFINETDRISKKRNDIDDNILQYEIVTNENIYEIKTKIIDYHEELKNINYKLNNIKIKNLEERKKVLDILTKQKKNRKKNKEKEEELKNIISKKNELLISYKLQLQNLPNKKREYNRTYYELKSSIDDKTNENIFISDQLKQKMENKDENENENENENKLKLLITLRDTIENDIETLKSKPEYDIYNLYKTIDNEKKEIEDNIKITENELKELENHKREIDLELKEVYTFSNRNSSQYKKYKDQLFDMNHKILFEESIITNYEKDLVLYNITKDIDLSNLLNDEDRCNMRWKIVNDRINEFYQRDSKEMEINYNNFDKVIMTLSNELDLLNNHKKTIEDMIKKKMTSDDDKINYLNTIKITSEITKLKKNIIKKKEGINTYQKILETL